LKSSNAAFPACPACLKVAATASHFHEEPAEGGTCAEPAPPHRRELQAGTRSARPYRAACDLRMGARGCGPPGQLGKVRRQSNRTLAKVRSPANRAADCSIQRDRGASASAKSSPRGLRAAR
jgi:hypothetical protein